MGQLDKKDGLISIQNVSVIRTDKHIINQLGLELNSLKIGIIGRNGSGKSTLARLICGLIKPDVGRVLIDGTDVFKNRRHALFKVGLLFQNPDHQIIFPTVIEEISFGLTQQGHSKASAGQKAKKALETFGHCAWADRSTSTLSQGQRHLVCLISVLVMNPAVIVLDEPFTGLDRPTTRQLAQILNELELTLVHISHDLELLQSYDRVVWLEHGAVAMDGPPQNVIPAYIIAMDARERSDAFADYTI